MLRSYFVHVSLKVTILVECSEIYVFLIAMFCYRLLYNIGEFFLVENKYFLLFSSTLRKHSEWYDTSRRWNMESLMELINLMKNFLFMWIQLEIKVNKLSKHCLIMSFPWCICLFYEVSHISITSYDYKSNKKSFYEIKFVA